MDEWLAQRHRESLRADLCDLVFRPFLRWLDKQAEELFTEGLSIYKREMVAKESGLTFIPHTSLQEHFSSRHSNVESDEDVDNVMADLRLGNETFADRQDVLDTDQHENQWQSMAQPMTQPLTKLNPAKRGTELKLKGLQLLDGAATLHCTMLRTGLQCSRCKTVHHIKMHSEKPYVVVCDKCRHTMSLIYHANLMHTQSNTMGYFDLDGCVLFDLILQDCQMVVGCLECGKDMTLHGLQSEQLKQFWCLHCHKKLTVVLEKGSFVKLNDGAAIKLGADAVIIAKQAREKSDMKILQAGKTLPDNGACKHYKKSYRWFRSAMIGCPICDAIKYELLANEQLI